MGRIYKLLFALALLCANVNGQSWEWVKEGNSINKLVIAAANDGNLFSAGNFKTECNLFSCQSTTTKSAAVVLSKTDDSGNLIWKKVIESEGDITTQKLLVNPNEVFLAGTFTESILIDNNAYLSAGGSDFFVLVFDMAGNMTKVLTDGGQENEYLIDADINQSEILLTGTFMNTTSISGITLNSNSSSANTFISKYNSSDLKINWAKNIHSDDDGYAIPMFTRFAADGSHYLIAQVSGNNDFGSGIKESYNQNQMLAHYNSDGSFDQMLFSTGGQDFNTAGFETDESGALYLLTSKTAGNTKSGMVLSKILNHKILWQHHLGGGTAFNNEGAANPMKLLRIGDDLHVSANYDGLISFPNGHFISGRGLLTAKYDTSGTFKYARNAHSSMAVAINMDIAVLPAGKVFFAGKTSNDILFGEQTVVADNDSKQYISSLNEYANEPAPQLTLDEPNFKMCEKNALQLSPQIKNLSYIKWVVRKDQAIYHISYNTQPSFSFNNSGVYDLNVYYGNSNTSDSLNLTGAIEIYKVEQPKLILNGDSLECITTEKPDWYAWNFDNNVLFTSYNKIKPTTASPHLVEVIYSNGCSAISDTVMINSLSAGPKIKAEVQIVVYPNPVKAGERIRVSGENVTGNFILTDITGKTVLVQTFDGAIDLSPDLKKGIYLLTVKTADFSFNSKLLVNE